MIQLELLLPPTATFRYDDDGEPAYTAKERLLMTMRWLEWATVREIHEVMCADTREAQNTIQEALCYHAKTGKALRRGKRGRYEYKLNPAAFTVRRVAAPRCLRCYSAAAPGKAQCQRHLDYDAARGRKARAA